MAAIVTLSSVGNSVAPSDRGAIHLRTEATPAAAPIEATARGRLENPERWRAFVRYLAMWDDDFSDAIIETFATISKFRSGKSSRKSRRTISKTTPHFIEPPAMADAKKKTSATLSK
jgi:hypothetical protein